MNDLASGTFVMVLPSSFTAASAISSITSSGWCGNRSPNVRFCFANAPHIIWPMRFVLPHHKEMRPAWLLRLGLFLYDHIGKRKLLPGTTTVDLTSSPVGRPLKPLFSKGFEYSDCWVNDARLVVLNALDAAERGADIRTRTQVVKAERKDGVWEITLKPHAGGL